MVEQVLVIPEESIAILGDATGFIRHDYQTVNNVLSRHHMRFMERTDELEANPKWKQLIPYLVLTFEDDNEQLWVFNYTRTKQQGEARLHTKRSIGIGGHVNTGDVADDGTGVNPFWAGAKRELDEEVRLYTPRFTGAAHLLYDPSNEVGKVHLGVVVRYHLDAPAVLARERSMANAGFVTLEQLLEEKEQFENWSQLCIEQLKGVL